MSKVKDTFVGWWNAVTFMSVLFPLLAGGLGGALYTHWVSTWPAHVEPRIGEYVLLMGRPLIGIMIALPNRGHSPGVVSSMELQMVGEAENRKTETTFYGAFTSGQLEIFSVAESGKLAAANGGDLKLSLFAPVTVSPGQTASAIVWFQPQARDFVFEAGKYRCSGKLIVFSGKDTQETMLEPFSIEVEPSEANAMNKNSQKNVLLLEQISYSLKP
jgi:hypothetical protein